MANDQFQQVIDAFRPHLLAEDMNEVYKVVDQVQDQSILAGIARFSVETRVFDLAHYVLARMGNVSNFVLSSQMMDSETNVKLAAIAIQLGHLADAEKLYIECKRYDLLNTMYQVSGDWDKALEVASKHDYVHLKNTHHSYAKHLESLGQIKDAIRHYELSNTHRYEVPRMMFSLQKIDELQDYIDRSNDSELQQWWAHFCEANDDLPKAIEYYKSAGDIASVVRVYCFLDDFKTAAETATASSDCCASFQLGRQYEKNGKIREAMQFFTSAGKSSYAAQLAMKHNVDSELLPLSLQCSNEIMLQSAKYFEQKGKFEEAILLYHKGGDLEKAIDVCFSSQLFDALKAIVDDLDENTNPSLLVKCGDFLLSHKQAEKAVLLFIAGQQHQRALDLCIKEGITITESMTDAFAKRAADKIPEEYSTLLMQLAECCEAQGSHHLACKEYTRAGERVKAMNALIKSGDTERIVLFANASRQKQLYVLAANYLQDLDWYSDANIMRTIVNMYTKAGEMELLASFYEACAQIEIDEFRDYDKALGAMKEALKYVMKSKRQQKEEILQPLLKRIADMEHFVQVRRMARTDPTGMVHACTKLLSELSLDQGSCQASIRIGDLYALLVEFYYSNGDIEEAYGMIEQMRKQRIAIGPYIDQRLLDSVYQAIGVGHDDSHIEGFDRRGHQTC